MESTMKQRHDGWLRRAVIGAGIALPLIAAVIWTRFDTPPLATMALQTPKAYSAWKSLIRRQHARPGYPGVTGSRLWTVSC
jgi:hypothetical protein